MLFTPAYIFTILLGIWVLSVIGCIALGIFCYRLVGDRRRLRARLEQVDGLLPGAPPGALDERHRPADTEIPFPPVSDREGGAAQPTSN